jgi:hypothetical protein
VTEATSDQIQKARLAKTIFYQLDASIRAALDLALAKKGPPVRQGEHLMQPILTATRMRGIYREGNNRLKTIG